MNRIQYRCRACPEVFMNAESANLHHDATGHHQTFRCPTCDKALSGHTDEAYADCITEATIDLMTHLQAALRPTVRRREVSE